MVRKMCKEIEVTEVEKKAEEGPVSRKLCNHDSRFATLHQVRNKRQ